MKTIAMGSAAVLLAVGLVMPSAWAQSFRVLHNFAAGPNDGYVPYAGLVRDAAGNLYGTTVSGGAHGSGTVYKINNTGTETILHSFAGNPDGANPYASLILDNAGNLFGTTEAGGGYNGTVFKVDASGIESVLYAFNGYPTDGSQLYARLVRDRTGNLYGTTVSGGTATTYDGTVFVVDSSGNETMLHAFSREGADGYQPWGGLVRDASGNLYGANVSTIFKLDPAGNLTVLSNQVGSSADLLRDSAGNLYGTAYGGGDHGYGMVFKLDPSGTLTTVYSFRGGQDGEGPWAGVVRDAAGNLYGTTFGGGGSTACNSYASGCGTVFKLDPNGIETVLHRFTGPDGASPHSSVILDGVGNVYGTTLYGGAGCASPGCGVVFKLRP